MCLIRGTRSFSMVKSMDGFSMATRPFQDRNIIDQLNKRGLWGKLMRLAMFMIWVVGPVVMKVFSGAFFLHITTNKHY